MIIGITGLKGSGKDTAATVFIRAGGFTHVKMADGLKGMLRHLLAYQGISAEEIERRVEGDLKEAPCEALAGRSMREAMITLGTEWGRNLIAQDLWIRATAARCKQFEDVVISDVRFPNEVQMVHDLGGKVYRVERPGLVAGDHPSEALVATLEVDGVWENNFPTAMAFQKRLSERFEWLLREARSAKRSAA